jgi:hypothetical protein
MSTAAGLWPFPEIVFGVREFRALAIRSDSMVL